MSRTVADLIREFTNKLIGGLENARPHYGHLRGTLYQGANTSFNPTDTPRACAVGMTYAHLRTTDPAFRALGDRPEVETTRTMKDLLANYLDGEIKEFAWILLNKMVELNDTREIVPDPNNQGRDTFGPDRTIDEIITGVREYSEHIIILNNAEETSVEVYNHGSY